MNYSEENKLKNIKVLVFDIDGTLINSEYKITYKTFNAILNAKNKGLVIGISTGRDAVAVNNLLKSWSLEKTIDFIVGMGGSQIYFPQIKKTISNNYLQGSTIRKLIEDYLPLSVGISIPVDGNLYVYKQDPVINWIAKKEGLIKYPFPNTFLDTPKPKLMLTFHSSETEEIIKMSQKLKSDEYISIFTDTHIYEYISPFVSKSNGVKLACHEFNFDLDDCVAFGDQDNDISMLKNCKIGVAMGNATAKTKDAADYITLDNDNDGIAEWINKYIL